MSSPDQLRPEHVRAVFQEVLGRPASDADVDVWMQVGSVGAFLDGVLASEEYAQRCARRRQAEEGRARGPFLNCWVEELEQFSRPPGEVSPDGVAIVGGAGHLFIFGGSNANLAVQRGEVSMTPGWLEDWRLLVSERTDQARAHGRVLACLVVPEKLAVYADLFPGGGLTPHPTRPVARLLDEVRLPLVYPIEELRAARAGTETYLRTDSHLTARGNAVLASATLRALALPDDALADLEEVGPAYLGIGDLGSHFDPPVAEVMQRGFRASRAEIVLDNRAEIAALGGHIGTMRTFRFDGAPIQRTIVVFGDSYGFGDEAYQGLSWVLAQIFREVHFAWVPFGWDPELLDRVRADFVVCQTAERFIGRVPRRSVDVRSLAGETTRERRVLTAERIFSDQPPAE